MQKNKTGKKIKRTYRRGDSKGYRIAETYSGVFYIQKEIKFLWWKFWVKCEKSVYHTFTDASTGLNYAVENSKKNKTTYIDKWRKMKF